MSSSRCVASLTYTFTAPPDAALPAGTIAAFALVRPSGEFKVDTAGCPSPSGQIVRCPSGPGGTTVTFSEYATAVLGIPEHGPEGMAKLRVWLAASSGPPKGPSALRVSTTRQGVTVKYCIGIGAG